MSDFGCKLKAINSKGDDMSSGPTILDEKRASDAFEFALAKEKTWVRIPSISNPNFDQAPVLESAKFVAQTLKDLGCQVRITSSKTHTGSEGCPAVIAKKIVDPKFSTVLLYAHHDVQPVNSPDSWKSDPFEPVERDGRLYARGICDDGSGLLQHFATLKYFEDRLPMNVICLIEGEEEVGSPSFANFIQDHRDELKADYYVIADSGEIELGVPCLTTMLRGVVQMEAEVKVLDHDVHSGSCSGPVLDPYVLIAKLVNSMYNDQGELAVEGLVAYDQGTDYISEAAFRQDAGVLPHFRLTGTGTITSRLWTKPTLTVTGMDIPSSKSSSNTIAPSAKVVLSLRFAPGDTPENAYASLKRHLESVDIFGAELIVRLSEAGPAYQAKLDSSAVEAASEAYREVWGKEPHFAGQGGTIPLTTVLSENYPEAEILVTSAGDPDSRAHSANESIDLAEAERMVRGQILLLEKLARINQG
jgi:acetylornithine deacetylase/succinyl-diaminopimelate desuccinylase-like protein